MLLLGLPYALKLAPSVRISSARNFRLHYSHENMLELQLGHSYQRITWWWKSRTDDLLWPFRNVCFSLSFLKSLGFFIPAWFWHPMVSDHLCFCSLFSSFTGSIWDSLPLLFTQDHWHLALCAIYGVTCAVLPLLFRFRVFYKCKYRVRTKTAESLGTLDVRLFWNTCQNSKFSKLFFCSVSLWLYIFPSIWELAKFCLEIWKKKNSVRNYWVSGMGYTAHEHKKFCIDTCRWLVLWINTK